MILIATHRLYNFPRSTTYNPIQVGKVLSQESFGYLADDTGCNISVKNPFYSELTALYWAWKNAFFKDADYCGLVHYRRYFRGRLPFEGRGILSHEEIVDLMQHYDLIVSKKRNYWIETIEKHYQHAHYKRDLDITKEVLSEFFPEYLVSFEHVMKGTKLHLYNMFVMPVPIFEAYCEWLFSLLFEIEKRIDISDHDSYQKRVFGFLAERLFNVWTTYQKDQKGMKIVEIPVVNIEGENFLFKAVTFLGRKLTQGNRGR